MQNLKNHKRIYPLHHLVLTPLTLVFFIWSIVQLFNSTNELKENIYFLILSVILLIIGVLLRIYAAKNQDRIIRLEMRFRYKELTGNSFSEFEKKLTIKQIVGLRFAGDEEIVALIDKAIMGKLSNIEIKKQITDWQEDNQRV